VRSLLNSKYAGRFGIEELVGEGANARVYRAWDEVRGCEVALKLYNEDALDHQVAEAATNTRVADCPAVMPLYEVLTDVLPMEATAMPLARGLLAGSERLAATHVRAHGLRLMTALMYCHGRGVIHGDIKPANLFCDRHGHLQLGDFGIRDFLPDGRRGHTLEYAAPELLDGEPRSAASDVWAANVTLYELFCGELPFGSSLDHPEAVVARAIARGDWPPVQGHRPYLPRRLQRYFADSFVVEPRERPLGSAEAAHIALAGVALRADWVRVRQTSVAERWEGVERDDGGERTGVMYCAELTHLPRAGRWDARVTRQRPGKRAQSVSGSRPCTGPSEGTVRQCMYSKMRALTEGRRPT
jgi:serine/threonine protein kinase